MKVIVCSKNKAKNTAVEEVIKEYIHSYEIISLETNSQVSETPIGDEEGLLGCQNRIKDAKKKEPTGDIYIAMEGILTETKFGTFLCGWTTIYIKETDEYLYGCSAKVKVPDSIMKNVTKEERLYLGKIIKNFKLTISKEEEVSKIGTNGLLTNGSYTRTDEFKDSIICAISTKYKRMK